MKANLTAALLKSVAGAVVTPLTLGTVLHANKAAADAGVEARAQLFPGTVASSVVSRQLPGWVDLMANGIQDLAPPEGTIRLAGRLYSSAGPTPEDVRALLEVSDNGCPVALMYAMASLAKVNPKALDGLIQREPNGDYTVNFYSHLLDDSPYLQVTKTSVHVSRFFPEGFAAVAGPNVPTWPLVLSKAIMDHYQARPMISQGRYAIQTLTGLGVGNEVGETVGKATLEVIKAQLAAGVPMVVHTHSRTAADEIQWMKEQGGGKVPEAWLDSVPREMERGPLDEKYGLTPSSVFSVVGLGFKDGVETVKLYDPFHDPTDPNPRQPKGRLELPIADFEKVILHLEPNAMRDLSAR